MEANENVHLAPRPGYFVVLLQFVRSTSSIHVGQGSLGKRVYLFAQLQAIGRIPGQEFQNSGGLDPRPATGRKRSDRRSLARPTGLESGISDNADPRHQLSF